MDDKSPLKQITREEFFKNKKKKKIGNEFVKLLLVVLVLSFGILTAISGIRVSKSIRENLLHEMAVDLSDIGKVVELMLNMETSRATLLSQNHRLLASAATKNTAGGVDVLQNELSNSIYLNNIMVMDLDSIVWAASSVWSDDPDLFIDFDMSGYKMVEACQNSEDGLYVYPEPSPDRKGNQILPVLHSIELDGEMVGVIQNGIDITLFGKEHVLSRIYGNRGFSFIVANSGQMLVHPDSGLLEKNEDGTVKDTSEKELGEDEANAVSRILAENADTGTIQETVNGEKTIYVYKKLDFIPWTVVATIDVKDLESSAFSLIKIIAGLSAFMAFLILVSILLFSRRMITKRLALLGDDMLKGSQGDLTVRHSPTVDDELSSIGFSLFHMMASFAGFLRRVRESIRSLRNSSDEMNQHISESASSINQINANIGNLRTQLERQGTSTHQSATAIEELSRSIDSLNDQIQEQSSSVTESSAAVEEIVANISSISRTLKDAGGDVQAMTTAADDGNKQLDQVLNLMNGIVSNSEGLISANEIIANMASRTNLLSMNAAIEAAHAGDAGKGFSVVADEIRNLAEASANQSRTVGENLKNIKTSIDNVMEASQLTKDGFTEIREKVDRVYDVFQMIESSVQELNAGSVQVLEGLKRMNEISVSVSQGSDEMKEGNLQIAQAMTNLKQISEESRLAAEEISKGMEEINNAVEGLRSISEENVLSVEEILEKSYDFKTE